MQDLNYSAYYFFMRSKFIHTRESSMKAYIRRASNSGASRAQPYITQPAILRPTRFRSSPRRSLSLHHLSLAIGHPSVSREPTSLTDDLGTRHSKHSFGLLYDRLPCCYATNKISSSHSVLRGPPSTFPIALVDKQGSLFTMAVDRWTEFTFM
jgi:hypothetical protein